MEVIILAKKRNDYFLLMSEQAVFATKAAEMLENIILNYNPEKIDECINKMHEIEHEADTKLHEIEQKLAKEFITTIEREDIATIGKEIDDIVDYVEDVLIGLYTFNVKTLREESKEFANLIRNCTLEVNKMMKKFKDFRKSDELHNHIVEVNKLEEQGDRIYTKSIRRLYTEESDTKEILIWTEIFNRMEKCCDKCEQVSNVVQNVIMKNI